MERWYVEVAFLVLLCFALGAGTTAFALARLLPQSSAPFRPTREAGAPSSEGGTS